MKFIETNKRMQELKTTNNNLSTKSIISMVGKVNKLGEDAANAKRGRLPVSPRQD